MKTYAVPNNCKNASVRALEFGHDHISGNTFQRILVPLDGSELSEQALPLAIELAQHDGAILGLVRVVPIAAGVQENDNGVRALTENLRDEARDYLDTVAGDLRARGIRATWEVRIGVPGEEIARVAETTAADIIVMASSHVTGTNKASVTDAAIHATNIPVIITSPSVQAGNPDSAH